MTKRRLLTRITILCADHPVTFTVAALALLFIVPAIPLIWRSL